MSQLKSQTIPSNNTSFASTMSFSSQRRDDRPFNNRAGHTSRCEADYVKFNTQSLAYKPRLEDKDTYRTVIINNLPVGISLAEVMEKVCGGTIYSAQLLDTSAISASMTVMVVFVQESSAKDFASFAKVSSLTFQERKAHITLLLSATWPIPVWLQRPIFVSRYTRCILMRDVPRHVTPFVLQAQLRLDRELEHDWVEYVRKLPDGSMQIVFENIKAAASAFAFLTSSMMFRACRISFSKDPCDRAAGMVEDKGAVEGTSIAETFQAPEASTRSAKERTAGISGDQPPTKNDVAGDVKEATNSSETSIDQDESRKDTPPRAPAKTSAVMPAPETSVSKSNQSSCEAAPSTQQEKPDPFASAYDAARIAHIRSRMLALERTAGLTSAAASFPLQKVNTPKQEPERETRPAQPPTPPRSEVGIESPKHATMQQLAAEMEEVNLREAYGDKDADKDGDTEDERSTHDEGGWKVLSGPPKLEPPVVE